jgi:hypothetical protein
MWIYFDFVRSSSAMLGEKTMKLFLTPPRGFDIVESIPPAERSSGSRVWAMQLKGEDASFLFRVRLRNYDAARLDHIIDSSIAAVLGVAVGGMMNAYLPLVILRRRPKDLV